MNIDSKQRTQLAIALGAIVAVVLGFSVLGKSDDSSQTSANAAQNNFGQQGQGPQGGNSQGGPSGATGGMGGPPGQYGGQGGAGMGRGGPPNMTQLTGTTLKKASAAAKAKVSGTVDHAFANPRGSGYIVIIEKSDGTHVAVEMTKAYKVTGTQEMGQGGPPQGQNGQQGAPPAVQGGNTQ